MLPSYQSQLLSTSPISRNTLWRDLYLRPQLIQVVAKVGYQLPTPIQVLAIPKIMQGHNVICQAQAGTGKTAVFVLGVLQNMRPQLNGQYLPHQCIVIANTRELAYQIMGEFKNLSSCMHLPPVKISCFYGGIPEEQNYEQLEDPKRSPHIIVGTPGRLLRLVQRGYINTNMVNFMVVDECDVNIIERSYQLNYISKNFSPKTQYIMASATMSPMIKNTIKSFCSGPVQEVCLDSNSFELSELTHFHQTVRECNKFKLLQNILDRTPFNQAIIFANTVLRAKQLSYFLTQILFNPLTIHSDLTQEQRIQTYDNFKNGGSRILVATDLFGRGIDILTVNMIINYDCPRKSEDYLHRVGRACRFKSSGVVITFVDQDYMIQERNSLDGFGRDMQCPIIKLPPDLRPYL